MPFPPAASPRLPRAPLSGVAACAEIVAQRGRALGESRSRSDVASTLSTSAAIPAHPSRPHARPSPGFAARLHRSI